MTGAENAECAAGADVVVAAVPWAGHADLLVSLREQLAGKILVDCVNPLGFDKQGAYALPVVQGRRPAGRGAPARESSGRRFSSHQRRVAARSEH